MDSERDRYKNVDWNRVKKLTKEEDFLAIRKIAFRLYQIPEDDPQRGQLIDAYKTVASAVYERLVYGGEYLPGEIELAHKIADGDIIVILPKEQAQTVQ